MQILIGPINMPIRHTEEEVLCAAQEIVRLHCVLAADFWIYKQSLDARRKGNIHYVYQVAATVKEGTCSESEAIRPLKTAEEMAIPHVLPPTVRPVVVGMGPCGLFAAYVLAKAGACPLLIERGEDVDRRAAEVARFWNGGKLNPESNVQFGEGGAGTFSDGKLNTRIGDPRQRYVLKTFVRHGAPEDILYRAKPHIGTDRLRPVVRSMREEIIRLGGTVRFSTCLTDVQAEHGELAAITVNHGEQIACRQLVLALGHSSRDTYRLLERRGIAMQPKAFAAGVRVEHPQQMIDRIQYGGTELGLPAADYRLVHNGKEHSCYSFCMCPGGRVVNASSEPEHLVVNGMSEYRRDLENANSALVVSVRPEDFAGDGILSGMEFQQRYEAAAWRTGGGDGAAPVQCVRDFMADRMSDRLRETNPSFTGKWRFAMLRDCLPPFIVQGLKEGMVDFERKMPGFSKQGIMTGVEMRTSAPVRILRDASLKSVSLDGLYPAGEGAGYAGGIVSAAVDGIRVAMEILTKMGIDK